MPGAKLVPYVEKSAKEADFDAALEAVRWAAALAVPDFEMDYEFVALRQPGEYPMNEGRIVSSGGLDAPAREFDAHFVEEQVAHSNALHSRLRERGAPALAAVSRLCRGAFRGALGDPAERDAAPFDTVAALGAGSGENHARDAAFVIPAHDGAFIPIASFWTIVSTRFARVSGLAAVSAA